MIKQTNLKQNATPFVVEKGPTTVTYIPASNQ